MKKIMFLAVAASLSLASCSKDDSNENPSTKTYSVQAYSSAEVTGNVVIVNNPEKDAGRVVVKGNPDLIANFNVRTENDVLYVEANSSASLSDSIYVEIGQSNLSEIYLNAQQQAVYRWVDDEAPAFAQLTIETRGGSKLWFYGLKADDVDVEMKGNSEVYLNTMVVAEEDSVVLDSADVMIKGDFIIANNVVYRSDNFQVKQQNGASVYVLYGDDVEGYYIINDLAINTVGTTNISTMDAATNNLNIDLTGNSEADVWVLGNISGEGGGSSILRYMGSPIINFAVSGSATILAL